MYATTPIKIQIISNMSVTEIKLFFFIDCANRMIIVYRYNRYIINLK